VGVVVLGLVFYSYSYAWCRSGWRHGARRVVLVGAVFGALTVVLMAARIPVAPGGAYIDARVVPVALAGLFEGPATGLLVATAGAVYRLEVGGAGTVAGVVALGLTAGAAALAWTWARRDGAVGPRHALRLSLAVYRIVDPETLRTVVVGSLELLARTVPADAGERRWPERAIASAQRIRDIVGRMNRIARVERKPGRPGLPPMLDIDKSSDVH
jgi:hypothetical protein